MKRFKDKVAIVTGASTGLGPVMAKMLVEEGAKVVLAARRSDLIEKVANDIGESAVAVQADVTDEASVAHMVDVAIENWGKVDVLMSNAAVPGSDKWIWEQTVENFIDTYRVDCMATMLCTREVLNRSMLDRKSGSIVTFSSGAGWSGLPRKSHYSAAKGALIVLSKTIAKEVGPYGIRCNCLVPGAIDTELLQGYHQRIADERGITFEQIREESTQDLPLKTFSTPEDVANMALFLASDQARTITGQAINVDGGYTI